MAAGSIQYKNGQHTPDLELAKSWLTFDRVVFIWSVISSKYVAWAAAAALTGLLALWPAKQVDVDKLTKQVGTIRTTVDSLSHKQDQLSSDFRSLSIELATKIDSLKPPPPPQIHRRVAAKPCQAIFGCR